jgi:hypothetical protein
VPEDLRLVCDRCHAYRPLDSDAGAASIAALRDHTLLGPFVEEHDDCRPPLRVTTADDERVEAYREHYEEA